MTPTARPSRGYSFSSTASAIAAATATTFVQSTRVLSLIRWVANRWRWCSDDLAKTRHRFRCQREFGAMEPTGSSNIGPCEWSGSRRHDTIRRKTYPDVKKSLEEVHLGRGWGEKRNICRRRKYHWFPRISFKVSREEYTNREETLRGKMKRRRETFR